MLLLGLLLAGGGAGLALYLMGGEQPGTLGLADELRDRRRVLLVGEPDLARLAPRSAVVVSVAEAPAAIREGLAATESEAFVLALKDGAFDAVLVDSRDSAEEGEQSVGGALGAYGHVPGLRARYLAPAAAVYRIDEVEALEPAHAEAMGHVARRIIAGDRPPRVASFPEPLRRVRNVEVMVLLRERGQARLWRSARGSSLARALVTAAVVARQRWEEREQAMGGPLDEALPNLTVEVVRLSEDGTLGARSEAFVERVFTAEHGVAYERRGTWHYQLPSTRGERGGAAYGAFSELFTDNGLEEEALERSDVRPYRLVATPLAVSTPSTSASDDPSRAGGLSLDAGGDDGDDS